jgi:hypothetical protein
MFLKLGLLKKQNRNNNPQQGKLFQIWFYFLKISKTKTNQKMKEKWTSHKYVQISKICQIKDENFEIERSFFLFLKKKMFGLGSTDFLNYKKENKE